MSISPVEADQNILDQLGKLRKEADQIPLVGNKESIESLRHDYDNSKGQFILFLLDVPLVPLNNLFEKRCKMDILAF